MGKKILERLAAFVPAFFLLAGFFGGMAMNVQAAIKDATVFENVSWEYMGETSVISDTGWLQSMCCTEDYIICLENTSTSDSTADTFLAFYKNEVDADGNPVTQYSLAKTVTETDYEHANGMTYNPDTREILVVGATPLNRENRGIVYIVDADTLKLKRTVRLSNGYKLLGVAYSEDTGHYVVQFFNDGYTESFFMELDEDFQQVGDVMPAVMWQDIRHQDFCISGDYLISLAFTEGASNSNVMHIYSLSQRELLVSYDLDILQEDGAFIEPESICEMGPGQILIGNAMRDPRRIAFYWTRVSAAFNITTSVENGTITGSQKTVAYASDYTISYEPEENYEIDTLTVDGEAVDPAEHPNFYVFEQISENHSIDVTFKEKPKFKVTTSVENGVIDDSVTLYRDKDLTVAYAPDAHYELNEILIDGAPIDRSLAPAQYTFENIQQDHQIDVRFTEIPSFEISTSAKNGVISQTESKIYRDENYTVYYHPRDYYKLAWIEVDGARTYVWQLRDHWNDYTFTDVQEPHMVSVTYYWVFLPWLVLGGAVLLILFFVSLIGLNAGYMRRRRLRRRYLKRRRIRRKRELNQARAEARVREKMRQEAGIRRVDPEDFVDK